MTTLYDTYCSDLAQRDSEFFAYLMRVTDQLLEIVKEADFSDERSSYNAIYQIQQWKTNYQLLFEDT